MSEAKEVQAKSEVQADLDLVVKIHQQLKEHFRPDQEPDWEPNEENVLILKDEEFEERMIAVLSEGVEDVEAVTAIVREMTGYADFVEGRLYLRRNGRGPQKIQNDIAHEVLHLWFNRNRFEDGKDLHVSYGANETFVQTLALEGLGFYNLLPIDREEVISDEINNSIIIREVIEQMGEAGWRLLFNACQTGQEEEVVREMQEFFGQEPPQDLADINDNLPVLFGKDFWGRLKESALMIYMIREDPYFEARNPAVDYQLILIMNWADLDQQSLMEKL